MSIQEQFARAAQNNGDHPSPLPGVDMLTYRNFVVRALSGDDSVPSSFMLNTMATRSSKNPEQQERDRKAYQYLLWKQQIDQHLEEIERLAARYREMADWHTVQAALARTRMNAAADKLEEIDTFVTGVNSLLEDKERTGKLDREKALELLRFRGVPVAEKSDDAMLVVELAKEKAKALDERAQWLQAHQDAEADTTYHEALEQENRRKAEELIERRDAIRKGGYDPEDESRLLQEVTEEYRRDVQRKALRLEEERDPTQDALSRSASQRQEAMDHSRAAQQTSEFSDFEALAASLSGDFNAAAAGAEPPTPRAPAPAGGTPGLRA